MLTKFRELRKRNQQLEDQLEKEGRRTRKLELNFLEEQQHRQRVELNLRLAQQAGDDSSADIIKSLRTELKSQEADISEARKIKERGK